MLSIRNQIAILLEDSFEKDEEKASRKVIEDFFLLYGVLIYISSNNHKIKEVCDNIQSYLKLAIENKLNRTHSEKLGVQISQHVERIVTTDIVANDGEKETLLKAISQIKTKETDQALLMTSKEDKDGFIHFRESLESEFLKTAPKLQQEIKSDELEERRVVNGVSLFLNSPIESESFSINNYQTIFQMIAQRVRDINLDSDDSDQRLTTSALILEQLTKRFFTQLQKHDRKISEDNLVKIIDFITHALDFANLTKAELRTKQLTAYIYYANYYLKALTMLICCFSDYLNTNSKLEEFNNNLLSETNLLLTEILEGYLKPNPDNMKNTVNHIYQIGEYFYYQKDWRKAQIIYMRLSLLVNRELESTKDEFYNRFKVIIDVESATILYETVENLPSISLDKKIETLRLCFNIISYHTQVNNAKRIEITSAYHIALLQRSNQLNSKQDTSLKLGYLFHAIMLTCLMPNQHENQKKLLKNATKIITQLMEEHDTDADLDELENLLDTIESHMESMSTDSNDNGHVDLTWLADTSEYQLVEDAIQETISQSQEHETLENNSRSTTKQYKRRASDSPQTLFNAKKTKQNSDTDSAEEDNTEEPTSDTALKK